MQTPFKRWQGPFQPPFARAPRSNLAAALAANALHWWDAGDRTSLLSGVDGSGGVVSNLPGPTGFAPAVSLQPSWESGG